MSKKLKSVFTDDMDHCFFTKNAAVERHHIFGGANRDKSEKYGFVVPLYYKLHPNGALKDDAVCMLVYGHTTKKIDLYLKAMSQEYYEEHYGTRQQFLEEFGRNYLGD